MRIRTVKPEFWENEHLAELSAATRLLAIALLNYADKEGRFEDRPKKIRGVLFPYEPKLDIDGMLTELAGINWLVRYEVEGRRFVAIVNFKKHQRPNVHEAESELPAPSFPCKHENDRASTKMISEVGDASIPFPSFPVPNQEGGVGGTNGKVHEPELEPTQADDERVEGPEELVEGWNLHVSALVNLSKVAELTHTRRQKAAKRIREHPAADYWLQVFAKIRGSPFLCGLGKPRNPDEKPFRASFDWLVDNDTNSVKVFEGKYDQ